MDQFVYSLTEGGLIYTEELNATAYRVLGDIATGGDESVRPLELPEVSPEVAAEFLPPEVVRYDQAGEFRTVVSCFLSFEGVRSHDELDHFATVVLDQVRDFGGYFKEVDIRRQGGTDGHLLRCAGVLRK